MTDEIGTAASASGDRAAAKFERRRAAIIGAAIAPLNNRGVRGMTLTEIAAQLGVVPTAVSYYFRRKEDLAAACFLRAIARYEALIETAKTEATPQAALSRFCRSFADDLRAVEMGEAELIATFNDVRTIRDPTVDAAYVEMFRHFRRAFAPAALTRRERNARTHLLLSQIFWAKLWLSRYEPADYGRMASRMSDILLHGLAARAADWSPRQLELPERPFDRRAASLEAFLRATTELVNEHGYRGASVAKISARLKVTKGSFYHHNEAKDDLIVRCFDRTLSILRRTQEAADRMTQTGLENLASVAATLVHREVSGADPLLRTSALSAVPDGMREPMITRFDRVSARLASVISDGIADGSIRPIDAGVAAEMVTAAINAGAELHHWAPGVDAAEAVLVYVRPLFVGMFIAHAGGSTSAQPVRARDQ